MYEEEKVIAICLIACMSTGGSIPVRAEAPEINEEQRTIAAIEAEKMTVEDEQEESEQAVGESGQEESGQTVGESVQDKEQTEQPLEECDNAQNSEEETQDSIDQESLDEEVEGENTEDVVPNMFYYDPSDLLANIEKIEYSEALPIEGLPPFITREMVAGALKLQRETGYPASVTIAQIIQESGYGNYGPGGEESQGLSYSGSHWAADIYYAKSLIETMEKYDLYRLDKLTLQEFFEMSAEFVNPCPGANLTSDFGYRTFDNSFHKGIDMGTAEYNLPVYAAAAGTVTVAGTSESAGNWIVIDHGNNLVTKYMHHEKLFVKEGQFVEKGQQIGITGNTGYSTGNHLHFQVEKNGQPIDPMLYLGK